MMHRCRGSHQGHVMGPCSCGMIHHHGQTNSFSMLFSKSYADSDMYSSSSSVDCTLSLATPSTRLSSQQDHDKHNNNLHDHRSVSNFCWDLLQSKHVHNSHQYSHTTKPTRTTTNTNISTANNNNNDPLLARRCANCDTTSTPLWRNGPRGPKSLCNACGIRFKKEERRAGAVAATTAAAASSGGVMETAAQMFSNGNNNGTWYGHSHHHNQGHKMMGNEFRYVNDDGDRREATPFLSWRLNVTDRPSLVHDFTR